MAHAGVLQRGQRSDSRYPSRIQWLSWDRASLAGLGGLEGDEVDEEGRSSVGEP